ncbi:hypothetical protein WBN73_14100 [Paenarthrobacter sp. CCNWLY172]|uniref:hypothetical protein n=1 Tax=unclassified Paenarthrobacter TaxID=2634190 RepID=UPI003076921A
MPLPNLASRKATPRSPSPRRTGVTIRNGIFVGSDTAAPYDTGAGQDITLPLSTTDYSQVNAEFIYRGSTIAPH